MNTTRKVYSIYMCILSVVVNLLIVFVLFLMSPTYFDARYYNLAHAVNERVVRQPSMLRKGTLRDYQLVSCSVPDV